MNLQAILDYFRIIVIFLRHRRHKTINNDETYDIEVISLLRNFTAVIWLWLQLIDLTIQWMNTHKRKKLLIQPLILVQLLAGYR